MDPRYMENCEFDFLIIAPVQHKKICEIKVGPDLLRLVSMLGIEKSYFRGRE